jgi:tetratricopeptide (TPR) repeat protein
MIIRSQWLALLMLVFFSGLACVQSMPPDAQKLKVQADDLEDKGAQAIDDGNMDQGLDFMARAIRLDPSPMRHMLYGSILFGNGVAVFKDSDQNKGITILRQAEGQLLKAIAGFNPNKDQVYLGQCYFLLGEMYSNAFGDKDKARGYYKRSVELNDYPGARDALNKLSP